MHILGHSFFCNRSPWMVKNNHAIDGLNAFNLLSGANMFTCTQVLIQRHVVILVHIPTCSMTEPMSSATLLSCAAMCLHKAKPSTSQLRPQLSWKSGNASLLRVWRCRHAAMRSHRRA